MIFHNLQGFKVLGFPDDLTLVTSAANIREAESNMQSFLDSYLSELALKMEI